MAGFPNIFQLNRCRRCLRTIRGKSCLERESDEVAYIVCEACAFGHVVDARLCPECDQVSTEDLLVMVDSWTEDQEKICVQCWQSCAWQRWNNPDQRFRLEAREGA